MPGVRTNKMKYKQIAILLLLLLLPLRGNADDTKRYIETNSPFKLHGRLMIYNGTPSFRIWIIGTNRLLGIPGGDTEPADMPKALEDLFTEPGVQVYGDFEVTPLTKYKAGEMQLVKITSVENLIIYKGDTFYRKMKKL
jgi:hypothetical protein